MSLDADSGISKCRGCGQYIKWVTTTQDRKMPVDPDKLTVLVVSPQTGLASVQYGYQSHISTCPDAEKFRRKEKKDA